MTIGILVRRSQENIVKSVYKKHLPNSFPCNEKDIFLLLHPVDFRRFVSAEKTAREGAATGGCDGEEAICSKETDCKEAGG